VWVLLEQGTLLRVDPDRHRVTGRLQLEAPAGGVPAGPLAVGAGAVWVGVRGARVTVRVDPVRLRVTGRLGGRVAAVARGLVWSYCCPSGDKFMGFGRIDARTLRPRPPLVVTDPGRVWLLSGSGDPDRQRDSTVRLRRLDQRRGQVTATISLPQLEVGAFRGPLGLTPGAGAVWVAGPPAGGLQGGGILLRVDPASGRVAGWLRDPLGFVPGVLAAGPGGVWVGTEAPALLHVVAA
jgi:streptogramin lyase